jgi:hypothetical protein
LVDATKLDKRQILIDACAAWYPHVQELTSYQYLDILAGVTNPIATSIQNNDLQTGKPAAAVLRDISEFCKGDVQSPMKILTLVEGGSRFLVQGGLGAIVWVIVNGHPGLFPGAGRCVENSECKIEWAETEATKGICRNAIHVSNNRG